MARYVLVASRDPHESRATDRFFRLAAGLAARGETVTLYLVQNGAFAARRKVTADALDAALRGGVEVLADDFSLRERGIEDAERHGSIEPCDMGSFVERVAGSEPARVLWH